MAVPAPPAPPPADGPQADVPGTVLHPLTLRFVGDAALEQAFLTAYERASVRHLRYSLLLAVFLYALFGLLDSRIIPDITATAWLIRYAVVCPCIMGFFALTFWPTRARLLRVLSALMPIVAGLGIVAMIVLAAPPGSYLYYAGLLLTCAYTAIFLRLRFVVATPLCWGLVAVYAAATVLAGRTAVVILVNNLFFLVGINVIGLAACYAMERAARTAFLDHRTIVERTRRLDAALSAAQEARQQAEALAQTDPLTGVANRRHLFVRAAEERARCQRTKRPLSLLMLDLDHFKTLNDRWGHATGDRYLQAVAQCLTAGVRGQDVVGRYGGEEFVVVLPEADAALAWSVAERLRHAVAALSGQMEVGAGPPLTVSVGLATLCEESGDAESESLDNLLERADRALYTAKARGRNRVVRAESSLDRDAATCPDPV